MLATPIASNWTASPCASCVGGNHLRSRRNEPNPHGTRRCPSGWFAAGREEVRFAATLLSDSAFKLFVWTCLHAERNSGPTSEAGSSADLARSLQKTEQEIDRCIQELVRAGVCCELMRRGPSRSRNDFGPTNGTRSKATPMTLEAYVAAHPAALSPPRLCRQLLFPS